jgi:DNA repair photolyase
MLKTGSYIKGRGAQGNSKNPFERFTIVREHWEGIDQEEDPEEIMRSDYIEVFPKTILNKVDSPDIGPGWSMNPYQGCEHGCIYCYARPSHNYWGYSAGTDFEKKILVKVSAAELLRKELSSGKWAPRPIMFSGNTDCYQPAERKFKITRAMLEVLLEFRNPAGIITKNALVLRDLDLLEEMSRLNLVHVNISFTTLQEDLRRVMEPRTSSVKKKLEIISTLSERGIPVNAMLAPLIPSLNSHEIMDMVKEVAHAGASGVNYTVVRLNNSLGELFEDWVRIHFPDRAEKVLSQVKQLHGGKLSDSRFGTRMQGEGIFAEQIKSQFELAKRKFMKGRTIPPYNYSSFIRRKDKQLLLF